MASKCIPRKFERNRPEIMIIFVVFFYYFGCELFTAQISASLVLFRDYTCENPNLKSIIIRKQQKSEKIFSKTDGF